ncbi:unnamed protein product [Cuscuta epithymum]|uniref:Uncharacterized protein n=1 Tax=Cuscuta epithymum TaxID=186058 RepID=A0AAV0EZT0_9ASTE|nr:unnamed protein product [Cuscuta epithymum]
MVREKINIKKIDSLTARQVTFSKRRRGLLKKAEELAVLCDAGLALIIFSATGKLFQFASSNMNDVLEKYKLHSSNLGESSQPSLELEAEEGLHGAVTKEVADMMAYELRNLKEEDLEGLSFEELYELEKKLEDELSRVIEIKGKRTMAEIANLERKDTELMEENQRLKQKMESINDRQSSESTTATFACSSGTSLLEDDC